jgi:hypothetical protein
MAMIAVGCAGKVPATTPLPAEVIARDRSMVVWGIASIDQHYEASEFRAIEAGTFRAGRKYCLQQTRTSEPRWFRAIEVAGKVYIMDRDNHIGMRMALDALDLHGDSGEGALEAAVAMVELVLTPCPPRGADEERGEFPAIKSVACAVSGDQRPAEVQWWPGIGWTARAVVDCTDASSSGTQSGIHRVAAAFGLDGRLEVFSLGKHYW